MRLANKTKTATFTLLGLSIGLVFSLLASGLDAWQRYGELSFGNLMLVQATQPLLWVVDTLPVVIGLLSMFAGIQLDKVQRLRQANQKLLLDGERRDSDLSLLVYNRTEKLENHLLSAEKETLQKSKFLATISHKFRTPMNGVVGMLGLLNKTELTALQQEYLITANNSAAVLVEVVNDILDYSRIESGQLGLHKIDFTLHLLLFDIVGLYSELAKNKGLQFEVDICDNLFPTIHADSTRLRQILNILLSNAIKFTQRGKVIFRVTQKILNDENIELGFTVSDTGIGISQGQLETVFNSLDQNSEFDDSVMSESGLALNIASHLVTMFGGKINVSSKLTEGTTFDFAFSTAKVNNTFEKVSNDIVLKQRRLLLISSNNTIVENIITTLADIETTLVHLHPDDWRGQLDSQLGEEWFDVVIFEQLSVGNKYIDIIKSISEIKEASQVRYMLLAAPGQRGEAQVAAEAGINAYLSLPFSPEQFLDTLNRLLAQQNGTQLVTKHTLEEDDFRPNRILVVEDNYTNQLAAKAILVKLGMTVDVVNNGSDAVSQSRQHQYKLVLMDCHMPNMDGFEAARQIRAIEKEKSAQPVPIVAMTVDVHPQDRQHCIDSGMDDFIAKPVTVDLLDSTVKKWMKKAG